MDFFPILKSKIFVSYLLSFLALLLLPMTLISILISFSFGSSAQKQYLETEQLMLRAVCDQLDSYISPSVEVSTKLVSLKGYRRFHAATAFSAYERQEGVNEIASYLNGWLRNSTCAGYCVYFAQPDMAISSSGSTYSFARYYSAMLDYQEWTAQQALDWVKSVDSLACSGVLTAKDGQTYFCLAQKLHTSYLHRDSYLLSFFRIAHLQYEIGQRLRPDSYCCIYTPDGTPVVSTLPDPALQGYSQQLRLRINATRYLRFWESSPTTGMQYAFYIPEASVLESLFRFQRTFWLIFAALLLGSVSLAFFIALRRYAPIKKLFAQAFSRADSYQEDFDDILGRLAELDLQDQHYRDEIRSQNLKLRGQALLQVLTTSGLEEGKLSCLLEEYGLSFSQPRFFVIVTGGCPAEQLALPGAVLCPFPIAGYCVLIVNDSPEEPAIEDICRRLSALQAAFPDMRFGVSSPSASLSGLYPCFREALENSCIPGQALHPVGHPPGAQPDAYPMDQELEILSALLGGDYARCEQLLRALYEKAGRPANAQARLLQSMAATALHVYHALGSDNRRPLAALEALLSGAGSEEERFPLLLQFYQAVAELCSRPQKQKGKNAHISGAVIQYIRQHYSDPSLSLNSVADAFHLSYYHLSHIFSDEVHQSFSSLLNLCRIEQAKKLLSESKMTAQDIALAVGYTNSSTFFRTFRKLTGLPPNEYRLQQRVEGDSGGG